MKNSHLIKRARLKLGLSREALARKCGLSMQTIYQLETGKDGRMPGLATIHKLCKGLGVDGIDVAKFV